MSRFIKLPVKILENVKISSTPNNIKVEGPKGKLEYTFSQKVELHIKEGELTVTPKQEKKDDAICGTTRALINNMIIGVTQGYEKILVIEGQGYRASMENNQLCLQIGFTAPVVIKQPDGITIEVPAPQRIIVRGIDKELVGKVASSIRNAKPPDPYKGKGVAYAGETIRRKPGKKAVGSGYGT